MNDFMINLLGISLIVLIAIYCTLLITVLVSVLGV